MGDGDDLLVIVVGGVIVIVFVLVVVVGKGVTVIASRLVLFIEHECVALTVICEWTVFLNRSVGLAPVGGWVIVRAPSVASTNVAERDSNILRPFWFVICNRRTDRRLNGNKNLLSPKNTDENITHRR